MGFGAYEALGSVNASAVTDQEAACLTRGCSATEASEVEHQRLANLWARVGLAVGVMGVGSAITLWVLDESDDGPTALMVSPSGLFVRGKM
jgi:hypothetical protein